MKTLKNAPIAEAIFDFRISFEEKPSIQNLEKIHEAIKADFPTKIMRSKVEASFGLHDGKQQTGISEEPAGFFFKSADNKKIVQSRNDGFTFNKLHPYDTWELFRDEAWKYWKLYSSNTPPTHISRLALRFVNKFEIPKPFTSIHDYLKTAPKIDDGIQQNANAYFMRLEFEGADNGCNAIVTSAIEQSPQPKDNLTILFDIDVFKDLEQKEITDNDILDSFEKLRTFKNDIFFKSMTKITIELFS